MSVHAPNNSQLEKSSEKVYTFVNHKQLAQAIEDSQPLRIEKYSRDYLSKDDVKNALLEESKNLRMKSDRKPYTKNILTKN